MNSSTASADGSAVPGGRKGGAMSNLIPQAGDGPDPGATDDAGSGPGTETPEDEIERIRAEVAARQAGLDQAYPDKPEPTPEPAITSGFRRQCYWAGELGDGTLFATAMKGKFVFHNTSGLWLVWNGNNWEYDIGNQALAGVERVVETYFREIDRVSADLGRAIDIHDKAQERKLVELRDGLYKRIAKLRTVDGRNKVLTMARTCENPLAIHGRELDQHTMLLACSNCVVDQQVGDNHPGKPEEYLFTACPTAWKGLREPRPRFEKFIHEIFDGDDVLGAYVQRLFGYAITGRNTEHILPVFHGRGRNGKGVLVGSVSHTMGPLAGPIQAEMLLDQGRPKSSAGASPDIMSLKGLRLAFCSETDEGQRFSASKVKWLTGGDMLIGRNPYDRYETRFYPTHTLFLLTNNKPRASADDFAFWERVHLVPFPLSFVDRAPRAKNERPADKNLVNDLKEEASGILAWLVQGCLDYQREGLNPPEIVLEATAQYRRDEDLLADFIEDKCMIKEQVKTRSSELFDAFVPWYEENISKKGITQKKFSTILTRRFEKVKTNGVIYYVGIELRGEDWMSGPSNENRS